MTERRLPMMSGLDHWLSTEPDDGAERPHDWDADDECDRLRGEVETYRQALEALRNLYAAHLDAHAIRGARIRVLEDSLRNISSQIGALIHA